MIETIGQLKGDFVVLDLGSAHTAGILAEVPGLTNAITLIAVDALLGEGSKEAPRSNQISLRQAVAGKRGRRVFKQRKLPHCSSFLDPKPELVQAYGLQDHFTQISAVELECDTITELLGAHGINRVDLFKTDLEGLDYEVLASAPHLVGQALCVQCESRFQPFFQGEPYFHEVASYLTGLGLELVSLRPATWKYVTPNQALQRDGRVVCADAIFFLSPKNVRERFGNKAWKCFAKQIIMARLLGLTNFAEYLHEQTSGQSPEAVRRELARFVQPAFSLPRFVLAQVNKLPLGWIAIGIARRFFRYGYKTTAIYGDGHLASCDLL